MDQNETKTNIQISKELETKEPVIEYQLETKEPVIEYQEDEDECQEDIPQNHMEHAEENESMNNVQTRQERHRRQPIWMKDYETSILCQDEMKNSNDKEWQEPIKDEIKTHLKNDTWTITDRKKDSNVIGYKM